VDGQNPAAPWLVETLWDVYHQLVQDFATINWFPSFNGLV